jgi:hypothetical protein
LISNTHQAEVEARLNAIVTGAGSADQLDLGRVIQAIFQGATNGRDHQ